jgi:hypothetical protein
MLDTNTTAREIINTIFNNAVAKLDGSRETTYQFRQHIMHQACKELGLTVAASASAYNHARKMACKQGLVVREQRGVLAKGPKFQDNAVEHTGTWLIVNKDTGAVEGSAESRRAAYRAKTDEQKVVKNF